MKEKKKRIYIITSGEYSDYGITRVFSTRKKALEYLDTVGNESRLEVYDIDEPVVRDTKMFRICFNHKQKKVVDVETDYVSSRYKNLIGINTRFCRTTLDIYVESDSKKRALKIASERYGAIIANEQFMFPLLRVGVINHYSRLVPALFDFNTGEMVLDTDESLGVDIPDYIKVKRIVET